MAFKQILQDLSQQLSLSHLAFLAALSYYSWWTGHPLLLVLWLR